MGYFVTLLIGGAVSGAIYSILAMGLVLSYATSRIFNFGQGAVAFSCAYLFFQFKTGLGLPGWLAALIIIFVISPLSGLAWDRLVFRRLTEASDSVKLVATIGVLLVMPALVILVCTFLQDAFHVSFQTASDVLTSPGLGPQPPIQWHLMKGLVISSDDAVTLAAAVILFVVLMALLAYTRLGLTMRTAVDRPKLAELRGTDTSRISAIAWIMSFMLAGVAGVVAAPIAGFGLDSSNYTVALFVAATAAIFARLRSLPIAFAGGLAIGAATSLASGYLNSTYAGAVGAWVQSVPGLQASLPYWALLVGLAIFAVERGRSAGVVSEALPPPDHLKDLARWRRRIPWIVVGVVFFTYCMGPINPIWRQTAELGLATAVVFLSYTIVSGIGGMISLAQPAFVTAAAVVMGYFIDHSGWPYLPAFIVGAIIAVLIGVVIALPALRLGGIPLALATLALALLGYSVVFQIPSLVNGSDGWAISRPRLGFLNLGNDRIFVIVLFAVVLFGVWIVSNLHRSASGRAMTAVRSSEVAASSTAVSPTFTKLSIFAISALFAGVGGMLLATASGSIQGEQYPPNPVAFLWLATVVVFGLRRPIGAVLAGITSVFFPAILTSGIHIGSFGWSGTTQTLIPQVLFGAAAIGLAKNPDGILAQFGERRSQRRAARRSKQGGEVARPMGAAVAPMDAVVVEMNRGEAVPLRKTREEPPVSAHSILELQGICAGYGEVEVLHDIELTIPEHSVVTLLGPNGSGKSTLCSVMGGLVTPSSGRVIFEGEDVSNLSAHERARRGLVMVPESRGIFPGVSVDDNLSLWLRASKDRDLVYQRFPNLANRKALPAGSLSGGEQQMLAIGPMLVRPPRLRNC